MNPGLYVQCCWFNTVRLCGSCGAALWAAGDIRAAYITAAMLLPGTAAMFDQRSLLPM